MEIIKLAPAFKDYLWGGTRLKDQFHYQTDYSKVAEAWVLSAHPDGPSEVLNGTYKGKTFIDYLAAEGKAVLGKNVERFEEFPILIKFIDAKQALSIQVHPDDAYALRVEHEYGKNEMWYIMDCDPGSFLYYGVNQTMDKEAFRHHIEDDTILNVLNKVEVKQGDCFFIEAGTIHAIGAGCLICEIQQNSNSTYRVYDFGRVGVDGKPRELHIDKAVDVSKLYPNTKAGDPEGEKEMHDGYTSTLLNGSQYFTSTEIEVQTSDIMEIHDSSFCSLVILEGTGELISDGQSLPFVKGDSFFIPAGNHQVEIKGTCKLIETHI
ncbi:mannose-6-phosphate isomerase [Erysipelotrichaceae bacterium MTC7]|nr:mannose-6-phosphate isomerase [Erysipelotrichaceae bacterium MTC7]